MLPRSRAKRFQDPTAALLIVLGTLLLAVALALPILLSL